MRLPGKVFLISLSLLLSAVSFAAETASPLTPTEQQRDANLGLLGDFVRKAYDEIASRPAPELQLVYVYGKSLLGKLEYLTPLLSDQADPQFFWHEKTKAEVLRMLGLFDEQVQEAVQKPKSAKLKPEYDKMKAWLEKYLEQHDLSKRTSLTKVEILSLTESSFQHALGRGVIKSKTLTRQELSGKLLEAITSLEKDSPIEWENGHLDQGYKLVTQPEMAELEVILDSNQLPVAYMLTISAQAKDPEGEEGTIRQHFVLNENFENVSFEPEEFE